MIMQEEQIREALNKHWHASAAGDANAEHDIYDEDAICDYPQSGERILGRSNLQALRSHHPCKPSGFNVKRILGKGDLWITEYTITYQGRPAYTVSIMEFRDGKVVHETQYFADPFEAQRAVLGLLLFRLWTVALSVRGSFQRKTHWAPTDARNSWRV